MAAEFHNVPDQRWSRGTSTVAAVVDTGTAPYSSVTRYATRIAVASVVPNRE